MTLYCYNKEKVNDTEGGGLNLGVVRVITEVAR